MFSTAQNDDAPQSALLDSGKDATDDANSAEASASSGTESADGVVVVDPEDTSPLSYVFVEHSTLADGETQRVAVGLADDGASLGGAVFVIAAADSTSRSGCL